MLPLEIFSSRQFASANLLALITYAALGGVIFLFVAFLQATLAYTALQAGAATLPITVLLLVLSARSGALAQRIGPRIPLAVGACLTGAGLLLMSQIEAGDEYFTAVMPSLVVFGVGLAAVITPITATVLATVNSRHAGIASGVNNVLRTRRVWSQRCWLPASIPHVSALVSRLKTVDERDHFPPPRLVARRT